MNTKLQDFIYSCSEFNGCKFCNEFNFQQKCPLKNIYSEEHEVSESEISKNLEICKEYVISSLYSLIKNNQ